MRRTIIILIILLWVADYLPAKIIYVNANGPGDPGSGSYEDPFRKIQTAIDSASNGDVIELQPGVYTGQGNYGLDPDGVAITIRSIDPNDADVVSETIIDPDKAGRAFYFHSKGDSNCVILGLTIRNGRVAAGYGGGIYCNDCSPTIVNCIIRDSLAWCGGGLYCYDSNSQIKGCTIYNNYATGDGGGLECWWGNPKITNCIVINNKAASNGGGIDCWSNGNLIITNCTVVGNMATSGGGVYSYESYPLITNSIVWDNGSYPIQALNGDIAVTYSDVQNGWGGDGNIDADPCFAVFDGIFEANLWDFHLKSYYGRWNPDGKTWVADSSTSPCIDLGDPGSDWNDEPWPNGKRINMGAYGGTIEASKNGNIADLNVDGIVNFIDFGQQARLWMVEQECIEDLTNNGVIDFSDLKVIVDNWLWQRE